MFSLLNTEVVLGTLNRYPVLAPVLCASVLLSGALFLVVPYLKRVRKFYATISRVPGPRCTYPLIGNADLFWDKKKEMSEVMLPVLRDLAQMYRKEGVFRFYLGFEPIVCVFTAEGLENILNSSRLIDKSREYGMITNWLGQSLLTSGGNVWRRKRRILSPAFHSKVLESFVPIVNEHALVLCKKLSQKKATADINRLVMACTLDTICETSLGININSQSIGEIPYVEAMHRYGVLYMERILSPWLWRDFIYKRTGKGKDALKQIKVMHTFTQQVVSQRKYESKASEGDTSSRETPKAGDSDESYYSGKKRMALLDLLLSYNMNDNSISEDEVRAEVETFMFAGHDTTGIAVTMCLFSVGHHPLVQENIFRELDQIFGDDTERPVTVEDMKRMPYLEATFKETLRLYPSVPIIGRVLTEDVEVNNYTVPKGTTVYINIHQLHRHEQVFPEPCRFDPDRFALEDQSPGKRHPFAYIPFSGGPRNCIGQRFALFEAKTILANIFRKFTVKSMDPVDSILLANEITLKPKCDVRVSFTPRRFAP